MEGKTNKEKGGKKEEKGRKGRGHLEFSLIFPCPPLLGAPLTSPPKKQFITYAPLLFAPHQGFPPPLLAVYLRREDSHNKHISLACGMGRNTFSCDPHWVGLMEGGRLLSPPVMDNSGREWLV